MTALTVRGIVFDEQKNSCLCTLISSKFYQIPIYQEDYVKAEKIFASTKKTFETLKLLFESYKSSGLSLLDNREVTMPHDIGSSEGEASFTDAENAWKLTSAKMRFSNIISKANEVLFQFHWGIHWLLAISSSDDRPRIYMDFSEITGMHEKLQFDSLSLQNELNIPIEKYRIERQKIEQQSRDRISIENLLN